MRLASSIAVSLLMILAACGGAGPEPTAPAVDEVPDRLLVFTVNYPLEYFADRLGGDQVEVVFPAPPGGDPAFWSPDPDTIAAYQGADLILLNGAGYAKWLERATLPSSKLGHILDHDAARWMVWKGDPMETTVASLDERGISSLVVSPCANTPSEGDWLTVMTANAEALETIAAAHR